MKWLPTLFAAEAIPSAMITFVALLMFLQLGIGWESSTLFCALLTLPWTMKSWVRSSLRRRGHFVWQLRLAEVLTFLSLVALAFSFTARTDRLLWVFLSLFVLCLCTAWHELVARMYYEQRLRRPQQRFYSGQKMFFTQSGVVLTYGVMIVVVGSLEVFFHQRTHAITESWSTAVYMLAGAYLCLLLWNLGSLIPSPLPTSPKGEEPPTNLPQVGRSLLPLGGGREGAPGGRAFWGTSFFLFILLLPQSLLFHARVLYLFASQSEGGLGCSLQWIGLAQGTVGVIAFSVGLIWGYQMLRRQRTALDVSCPQLFRFLIPLGLSPLVYWLMTQYPPANLFWLCVCTATAQFCFGFGLNGCSLFLRHLFGERYSDTINYLFVPLISLVMLPAMAASGWLVARLGFEQFFTINALLALPAWLAGYIGWKTITSHKLP